MCVHIEIVLKKGESLSGWNRTTRWECAWEHFLFEFGKEQGQFQCKHQFDSCPSQVDAIASSQMSKYVHRIETTNWFYFRQYASGDGNRLTLKKIGFFSPRSNIPYCWVEPVENAVACDSHRQSKKFASFQLFLIIGCTLSSFCVSLEPFNWHSTRAFGIEIHPFVSRCRCNICLCLIDWLWHSYCCITFATLVSGCLTETTTEIPSRQFILSSPACACYCRRCEHMCRPNLMKKQHK